MHINFVYILLLYSGNQHVSGTQRAIVSVIALRKRKQL